MKFIVRLREQGLALVTVLWVLVFLSALALSFSRTLRAQTQQTFYNEQSIAARNLVQAGVFRAIAGVMQIEGGERWLADDRIYRWQFNGGDLWIRLQDEATKMDLNWADEVQLKALLAQLSLSDDKVQSLAAAILDWRDADDLVRVNGAESSDYQAAGYEYDSANRPFHSIDELLKVMGMEETWYRRLQPVLTVHSGRRTTLVPRVTQSPQVSDEQRPASTVNSTRVAPQVVTVVAVGRTSGGGLAGVRAIVSLRAGSQPFHLLDWREVSVMCSVDGEVCRES